MIRHQKHNRPPFDPKIPGTDLRSQGVPMAWIYRPAKSVTQSGPRKQDWVLEFEPSRAKSIDPLMGWTASSDPFQPIRLIFPDRDSAIAFAEHNDWQYIVRDDPDTGRRTANPWRGQEAHQLYRGEDVPGMRKLALPWPRTVDRAQRYAEAASGDVQLRTAKALEVFDPVLEADLESFPASDAPSWTGTTLASRASTE